MGVSYFGPMDISTRSYATTWFLRLKRACGCQQRPIKGWGILKRKPHHELLRVTRSKTLNLRQADCFTLGYHVKPNANAHDSHDGRTIIKASVERHGSRIKK